jgi:hypothetical protein
MNWKLAEAIDIQRIWASHDLRSVLFYLKKIVNVTITKDDLANFKTRGALNAFLILQLGVDYLLSETQRMEAEVARDNPEPSSVYTERIAEFNRLIEAANRAIAERDATIAEHKATLKNLRIANHCDRKKIRDCLGRLKAAAPPSDSESGDEPGAIADFPRKRRRAPSGRAERPESEGRTDSGEGDKSGTMKRVGEANSRDSESF